MLARMELAMIPKKQTLVTGELVKPEDSIAVVCEEREVYSVPKDEDAGEWASWFGGVV